MEFISYPDIVILVQNHIEDEVCRNQPRRLVNMLLCLGLTVVDGDAVAVGGYPYLLKFFRSNHLVFLATDHRYQSLVEHMHADGLSRFSIPVKDIPCRAYFYFVSKIVMDKIASRSFSAGIIQFLLVFVSDIGETVFVNVKHRKQATLLRYQDSGVWQFIEPGNMIIVQQLRISCRLVFIGCKEIAVITIQTSGGSHPDEPFLVLQ